MIPSVFDLGDGIRLEFDNENGSGSYVDLDDASSQQLIDLIQNKLNARLGF